jgi:predicted dehydrogenase
VEEVGRDSRLVYKTQLARKGSWLSFHYLTGGSSLAVLREGKAMKKESRLLRLGVLGCGPIAQFAHLDACRKARNAELYAICDVAEDLLTRMASIHEPRVTYHDYTAMLEDPQVEAVIIATADAFHVPFCLQAIEAQKHVLVEKPMGVTVEECEALRDRLRGSGVLLQVGNNRRFDPGMTFARRFIEDEMGQHVALKAWYCDSTYRYTMTDNLQPIPWVSQSARRPQGNPKADKRKYFMLTHGSHLVDTARFLGVKLQVFAPGCSSALEATVGLSR